MNTNPAGNTRITDARETVENGEFERFEALMSGLVQVSKKDLDKQPQKA